MLTESMHALPRRLTGLALVLCALAAGSGCTLVPTTDAETTSLPQAKVELSAKFSTRGIVTVTERVAFSTDVSTLTLSPRTPGISSGATAFAPKIRQFRVSVPGQGRRHIRLLRASQDLFFSWGVPAVTIRYQLHGASSHQSPSVSGRYLAYVTGLDVGSVATDPMPRTVTVERALNLACAEPGEPLEQCGGKAADAWTADLPAEAADTDVYAQVDMG